MKKKISSNDNISASKPLLAEPAVIKRYGGIEITLEQAEAIINVFNEVTPQLGDFGKSIKEYLACQTKLINDGMPFHKRPSLDNRAILAKELFAKGYSIRQIARKLNYKSPRSVQLLLNRAVANVL